MHLNLSWPSWPLVETWWAKTNQECKSQQVMENTEAAPICMCADALRICFSKKAPAGERWGQTEYSDLLPLSIRDVLCCCDSSYSRWSVLASKDKRDCTTLICFHIHHLQWSVLRLTCGTACISTVFFMPSCNFFHIQRVALSSSRGLLYILYSGAMCPALSLCNRQHWNCVGFFFTVGSAFFYQFGNKWGLDPFYWSC